jgi:hypothetical protein
LGNCAIRVTETTVSGNLPPLCFPHAISRAAAPAHHVSCYRARRRITAAGGKRRRAAVAGLYAAATSRYKQQKSKHTRGSRPLHLTQSSQWEGAEAEFHDARHGPVLEAAAACTSFQGSRQANSQGRHMAAAAAQQQHALLAVATPQLQRGELERALRQREPQAGGRLQVMRARAAGGEDGASGGGVQHKRHDGELVRG